jgi:hypothetical protein
MREQKIILVLKRKRLDGSVFFSAFLLHNGFLAWLVYFSSRLESNKLNCAIGNY